MGNLRSVEKAFHKVGMDGAFVTDDPAEVARADKAVLPGDGAFDSTMHSLRRSGVDRDRVGVHRLGPPLSGHLRRDAGAADRQRGGRAGRPGLDVVPGRVRRFPSGGGRKVPQIGWNDVAFAPGSPLGADLPGESPMAYFLHSYYCAPDDPADWAPATTDYGVSYCSALHRGNVWATQFHPEKSGPVGLAIFRNFARL